MADFQANIECHCGLANQTVTLTGPLSGYRVCHCQFCRYSSGQLMCPRTPLENSPSTHDLRETRNAGASLYFCPRCGCHVFQQLNAQWFVATGTITSDNLPDGSLPNVEHHAVETTLDGGLATFFKNIRSFPSADEALSYDVPSAQEDHLKAKCWCGRVELEITRPSKESLLPTIDFPDLMRPYSQDDQRPGYNPDDEKWWMVPQPSSDTPAADSKYLAGHCACASCRRTSGFKIQSWAFIPRANIFIRNGNMGPLSFDDDAPARRLMSAYKTSPNVERNFCTDCGATIFYHNSTRPGLMDVSVGLLRAKEGVLARDWLSWWTARVSFSEQALEGRHGASRGWAGVIVDDLEEGLRRAA